ncbi:MAG: transcriptional regulator [Subtercola sp.]|nr:transcriptional regulator [Subtercola sp.]
MTTPVKLSDWQRVDDEECRQAAQVLEIVGKRWSSGILLAMARGADRFTAINTSVRDLTSRMLAVRLRELEHAGLVDRVVIPTMPVGVRYRLTAQGRDLLASLQPIAGYTHRWN